MVGKKGPRKLLVASVGVATINYALMGCDTFAPADDSNGGTPDTFTGTGGKSFGTSPMKGGGPPSIPPTSGNLPTPMPMGGFAGGGFAGQNFGGAAGGGMGGISGGGMGGIGGGGMGGINPGDGGDAATGGDASGGDGAGGAEGAAGDGAGGEGAGGAP